MMKRLGLAMASFMVATWSVGALAGEVNGSTTNPKRHFSQGASVCKFSGLNDDPSAPLDGSGPNGPGGRTQSYGQDVRLGLLDPTNPDMPMPGTFCDPNNAPPEPE